MYLKIKFILNSPPSHNDKFQEITSTLYRLGVAGNPDWNDFSYTIKRVDHKKAWKVLQKTYPNVWWKYKEVCHEKRLNIMGV